VIFARTCATRSRTSLIRGLGQVDCNVLDDDQVRRGLIHLSTQYGLDAITLTTYEGVMYAALKKAIAKGWRDRANPLEAPINIVVEKPLPRRGRIRPGTVAESVHRVLKANPGVWYSVAEMIPLVGLGHADGRPMTRPEAQTSITATLRQLLFGEATGIRCAPRMLEPAPHGPHRTHLCIRVWTYDPSLPYPAPQPGALDGEAVTMIGSLRAYCALPWAERMVACTQRLIGTRIGETLACQISDYVPGDRSEGKRGLLHLFRNPKPRTNSVRWGTLPSAHPLVHHSLGLNYRGWPIEEHPITGMQMVEEGLVQDYSREHQLPPGCISTKEAGHILGVSAERAAGLAHKHGWIVARYEVGRRIALDPTLVRAYAGQTSRIPPGSPLP